MTKDVCDGHFPGTLTIHLLIFSKIIALTGEILISWAKKSNSVSLAIRASDVKTESRELVMPSSLVITEADFQREKMNHCWISAKSWVGNKNVASIDRCLKARDFLIPKETLKFPALAIMQSYILQASASLVRVGFGLRICLLASPQQCHGDTQIGSEPLPVVYHQGERGAPPSGCRY